MSIQLKTFASLAILLLMATMTAIIQPASSVDAQINTSQEAVVPLFYDDFETGQLSSNWSLNTNDLGIAEINDNQPYSGNYNAYIGKKSNTSGEATAELILTVDLSGQSDVFLDFWWREVGEQNGYSRNSVYISNDGVNWVNIHENNSDLFFSVQSYRHELIYLDDLVAGNSLTFNDNFHIKFTFREDDVTSYVIDNVKLTNRADIVVNFPFNDDFESGTLEQGGWYSVPYSLGLAQVNNDRPFSGTYNAYIGKKSPNSGEAIAELILPIDLTGQSDVFIDFWWREFGDTNGYSQNSVYISDNDGKNWHNVSGSQDIFIRGVQVYRRELIYLDNTVEGAGLQFNKRFQIKFRFRESDQTGYLLDNVRIVNRSGVVASLPFQDDFEAGNLEGSWYPNPGRYALAEVNDDSPHGGTYNAYIGKKTPDSGEAVAELILPINLTGQSQVFLNFWWREVGQRNGYSQNNIYISDNDGLTWHVLFSFTGGTQNYTNENIDLSEFMESNNLDHNHKFQIKFRFRESDQTGFAIDDIRITSKGSVSNTPTPVLSTPTPISSTPTPIPTDPSAHRIYLPLLIR